MREEVKMSVGVAVACDSTTVTVIFPAIRWLK